MKMEILKTERKMKVYTAKRVQYMASKYNYCIMKYIFCNKDTLSETTFLSCHFLI